MILKLCPPYSFILFFFLFVLTPNVSLAQPDTGRFLEASAGVGYSFADDTSDITGTGVYAQGEYVFALSRWFGVRPYAGVLFTWDTETLDALGIPEYKATTRAFMLGGKIRLAAPIPWVAPYLETGIGLSFGSLETLTIITDNTKNGVIPHIPLSVGLALGRKHRFELGFTYYYHPSADQINGAAAIGLSFPLN